MFNEPDEPIAVADPDPSYAEESFADTSGLDFEEDRTEEFTLNDGDFPEETINEPQAPVEVAEPVKKKVKRKKKAKRTKKKAKRKGKKRSPKKRVKSKRSPKKRSPKKK